MYWDSAKNQRWSSIHGEKHAEEGLVGLQVGAWLERDGLRSLMRCRTLALQTPLRFFPANSSQAQHMSYQTVTSP